MSLIYVNLAAEMARKQLRAKDIAKVLGISQQSMNYRIAGKIQMSINEAFKIRDALFPTLMVDYLFDTKPRYDLIDIFNFPDKRDFENNSENSNNDPNDCA